MMGRMDAQNHSQSIVVVIISPHTFAAVNLLSCRGSWRRSRLLGEQETKKKRNRENEQTNEQTSTHPSDWSKLLCSPGNKNRESTCRNRALRLELPSMLHYEDWDIKSTVGKTTLILSSSNRKTLSKTKKRLKPLSQYKNQIINHSSSWDVNNPYPNRSILPSSIATMLTVREKNCNIQAATQSLRLEAIEAHFTRSTRHAFKSLLKVYLMQGKWHIPRRGRHPTKPVSQFLRVERASRVHPVLVVWKTGQMKISSMTFPN